MGPAQPPQRKGHVPQYSRDKLVELQEKFDELEQCQVFRCPEDVGITVEYLNPSFLVKKPSGGFILLPPYQCRSIQQTSTLVDARHRLNPSPHCPKEVCNEVRSQSYMPCFDVYCPVFGHDLVTSLFIPFRNEQGECVGEL